MTVQPDMKAFGKALGHDFREPGRALVALTHASLINEPAGKGRVDNTRSEYLGDAVLELAIRTALAKKFPAASLGQLDRAKQRIVTENNLAGAARRLGLGAFLQRGASHPPDSDAVLAQLFEACVGAVLLDSDFDVARRLVERHLQLPERV